MLMSWFRALLPREERFFDLFNRHAQTLVAGAAALQGMLRGGSDIQKYCQLVTKHESESD